ncbi:MAG: hypothetical protein SF066_12315 [Thermoanaerobaculia bacterium]|nr:hypothetical protein [Thermoanaerobaculia bacterium]
MIPKRVFLVLALVTLVGAFPVSAVDYWCNVGIAVPFDSCTGGPNVNVTFNSGTQRVATVDTNNVNNYTTFILRTRVCNGSGFSTHIADSPTQDGFGGDSGSSRHDSEFHASGSTLLGFRSDIGTTASLACQFTGPASTAGCVTQDWIVANDSFQFDGSTAAPNAFDVCNHPWIFDLPPYDEADAEDPGSTFADKLYVGLNRVVSTFSPRTGAGVQEACFFLTTTAYNPAMITASCGF